MEKDSLTISLPRAMKAYINGIMHEGQFSTPSEYIRALVRSDQEARERRELEAFVRRGIQGKNLPSLSAEDWASVEALILKCGKTDAEKSSGHHQTKLNSLNGAGE
jgi:putative addiction module CopG family antidote